MSLLGSYEDLIIPFMEKGYEDCFFDSAGIPDKKLILRHDIDFDCKYAEILANKEKKLGVKSTYFFMISSDSYNFFSAKNLKTIENIAKMEHRVSLHFDPLAYDVFKKGFQKEIAMFESYFNKPSIISIHRPNDFFLNYNEQICDTDHTYMDRYFKNIKYISDSRGQFGFGHPHETEEFKNGKTIHLLTHPVWWDTSKNSVKEALDGLLNNNRESMKKHYMDNCKAYKG